MSVEVTMWWATPRKHYTYLGHWWLDEETSCWEIDEVETRKASVSYKRHSKAKAVDLGSRGGSSRAECILLYQRTVSAMP